MKTTIPMTWSENGNRPNDREYCACCDRWVAEKSRYEVEVTADMSDAIHPECDDITRESGGFFVVGPDCAKKYLKGFAIK